MGNVVRSNLQYMGAWRNEQVSFVGIKPYYAGNVIQFPLNKSKVVQPIEKAPFSVLDNSIVNKITEWEKSLADIGIFIDSPIAQLSSVEEMLHSLPYQKMLNVCQALIPLKIGHYEAWMAYKIEEDFKKLAIIAGDVSVNSQEFMNIICAISKSLVTPAIRKGENKKTVKLKVVVGETITLLKALVKAHLTASK